MIYLLNKPKGRSNFINGRASTIRNKLKLMYTWQCHIIGNIWVNKLKLMYTWQCHIIDNIWVNKLKLMYTWQCHIIDNIFD